MPVQAAPYPHGCSHLQGEPFAVMAYAHQMVDMLTEENRMLRQEMEVCRDKVTKLHKVEMVVLVQLAQFERWRSWCWCEEATGTGFCSVEWI